MLAKFFIATGILYCLVSASIAQRRWPTTAEEFPATKKLPDLFTFDDGTKVKSRTDWERRREELIAPLLHYQYGSVPPKPDIVTAKIGRVREHSSGLGTVNELTLIIGSKKQLPMRAVLYQPKTEGPHPVIIEEEGNPGHSRNVHLFLAKNYIFIEYARGDLDPGREGKKGPAQKAYPEHDWAMLAAWAWGGMRVVDYLETRGDIDMKSIAITGHSRGGKASLLAAALDERITLAAPNQSGAGGAGCSRILGPGAESIGMNDKPHWYHPRILMFAKKEAHLPFDQHFLKALVAPRALICLESSDDLFANPVGTQATSEAATPVFKLYGREAFNGLKYRRGGHSYSTEDWQTLLDFAEWTFYRRRPAGGKFDWSDSSPTPVTPDPASGGEPGFVRVGDPGDAGDTDYPRVGSFGAVGHAFEIGQYKVSNAEYAIFLNAVASVSDPHHLFHPSMKIRRNRREQVSDFVAHSESANAAVTYISWSDALRYCNWRHGGDMETGAYDLSTGKRQRGANFFLPTDHEWYKAAYYDPRSKRYRLEPLRNVHKLEPGEKLAPKSRYGMLGAADLIWEWTESKTGEQFRGLRSDSWYQGNNHQAKGYFYSNPNLKLGHVGFRICRAVE